MISALNFTNYCIQQLPPPCSTVWMFRQAKARSRQSWPFILGWCLIFAAQPLCAQQKDSLSDEDILNPKLLIFNQVVPFVDSFDGARVGTVFVTKRSILAHPRHGFFGESCTGFCPAGTDEIDASYVYVFQKKRECVIGVRSIGWGEKLERAASNGAQVEVGRVRHQSKAANISSIAINGTKIGPPTNAAQLNAPNGTNYKYYPRRQNSLGKSTGAFVGNTVSGIFSALLGGNKNRSSPGYETYSSTTEGYITDIHYFPAGVLVKAAAKGDELNIDLPNWLPSRIVIVGDALTELRQLTATCDLD
jgi:hypothetical protein